MATATAEDVSIVRNARESLDRNASPAEFDQLAFETTRWVLRDWANRKNDTELFMGIPPIRVDSVAAYGSYQKFSEDYHVDPIIEPVPSSNYLNLFGWEFMVPNNPGRSNEDLLKEALELANLDETRKHRQVFHKWRGKMMRRGNTSPEVVREMEDTIQDYRDAVSRSNIITGVKYAFAVVTAVSGAAAFAMPLLGIPAAFAGFGAFVIEERFQREIPEKLQVAAMFHDARKRFGWRP
jgi:hypothetical protein